MDMFTLMVALVAYRNVFPKQTNNRLLAYYRALDEEEQTPRFYFIKGKSDLPGFRIKSFQTFLLNIPYIGILFGILSAWFFFLINRKDKIIYLYDPNAFWWPLTRLWRMQGRKLIVERTELHSRDIVEGFKARFLRQLYESDERTKYQHQVVISERIQEKLLTSVNSEITVIPAFFESHHFHGAFTQPQGIKVGYLGSFGKKDMVEGIIQAVEFLRDDHPNAILHLYGPLDAFLRFDQENALPAWVSYEGSPVYTQLADHLRSCSVLVSLRDRSIYSQFGFPTKLIEYLASGVPVISTNSAEVDKIVRHEEHLLLCDAEDVHALASNLKTCANDEESAYEMAVRSQDRVTETCEFDRFRSTWLDLVLK